MISRWLRPEKWNHRTYITFQATLFPTSTDAINSELTVSFLAYANDCKQGVSITRTFEWMHFICHKINRVIMCIHYIFCCDFNVNNETNRKAIFPVIVSLYLATFTMCYAPKLHGLEAMTSRQPHTPIVGNRNLPLTTIGASWLNEYIRHCACDNNDPTILCRVIHSGLPVIISGIIPFRCSPRGAALHFYSNGARDISICWYHIRITKVSVISCCEAADALLI